jgi:hypothetical protein
MGDSKGRFPKPYVDDVREDDPIMKRVQQDKLDIGARASGMPKGVRADEAKIEHVGDNATGKK